MPYINQETRPDLTPKTKEHAETSGELNFQLTELCRQYIQRHGESYSVYNDILGALVGCTLELYRRKIGPYEDEKIETNGDVY